MLGEEETSWGLSHKGLLWHAGRHKTYIKPFRWSKPRFLLFFWSRLLLRDGWPEKLTGLFQRKRGNNDRDLFRRNIWQPDFLQRWAQPRGCLHWLARGSFYHLTNWNNTFSVYFDAVFNKLTIVNVRIVKISILGDGAVVPDRVQHRRQDRDGLGSPQEGLPLTAGVWAPSILVLSLALLLLLDLFCQNHEFSSGSLPRHRALPTHPRGADWSAEAASEDQALHLRGPRKLSGGKSLALVRPWSIQPAFQEDVALSVNNHNLGLSHW